MMKKYAIALKYLNIEDELIIKILEQSTKKELKNLFLVKNQNIIEKDLSLLRYKSLFENKNKIDEALKYANDVLKKNKKLGIRTLLINEKGYPTNLKLIENPPPVLYFKGKGFRKSDEKALACVGTRNATIFSGNATKYLIPNWVREGFIIVAGLALGVDSLAHNFCINSGGRTVAVLAHGLDKIYPKENEQLSQEILRSGGTLVSEYPVGTEAEKFRFVKRNRLIVGLSKGTVIFECKIKSGTMHSAEFTHQQSKPIFCPNPGNGKLDIQQQGIRYLLEEKGAIIINGGNNFEIPIFYLGYKLRRSPSRLLQIKQLAIHSILSKIHNIKFEEVQSRISNKENLKRVSISVDIDKYENFKKIAKENNLTTKELFNCILFAMSEEDVR